MKTWHNRHRKLWSLCRNGRWAVVGFFVANGLPSMIDEYPFAGFAMVSMAIALTWFFKGGIRHSFGIHKLRCLGRSIFDGVAVGLICLPIFMGFMRRQASSTFEIPINVQVGVDNDKNLTIANLGWTPILDVRATSTEYVLDEAAWASGVLKIANIQKSSGSFFTADRIAPENSSESYPMLKSPNFSFRDWDTLGNPIPFGAEDFRRHYAIRVTFTEEKTKRRYVVYKVTSALSDGVPLYENPETVAIGGPPVDLFYSHIPDCIISNQRSLFENDEAQELMPSKP